MLVVFKSKAYENITMFGDVAIKLIKMLGHSGKIPGAILADEIPYALSQLKDSLNKHKEPKVTTDSDNEADNDAVNLSQRAFPLIEMLTHAAKEHSDVMWDKS